MNVHRRQFVIAKKWKQSKRPSAGEQIKCGLPIEEINKNELLINAKTWMNLRNILQDIPGGPVVKNRPATAGDMSSIPGQGRFPMLRSN